MKAIVLLFNLSERTNDSLAVIQVVSHPSGVLELCMKKRDFKMAPGQYVLIQCPSISTLEWHPFTLTSAPQEDFFSVHIRAAGDWTEALCKAFGVEGQPLKEPWSLPRWEPISFLCISYHIIKSKVLQCINMLRASAVS